jgi:hypothetical protein
MAAATIIRGVGFFPSASVQLQHREVGFLSFFQVSACEGVLHRTIYNEGLPAIDPHMSKPLTVEPLCHSTFSFVGFNPDDDKTEIGQLVSMPSHYMCHQKERDIINLEAVFSFGSGDRHLSHTDDNEAKCQ